MRLIKIRNNNVPMIQCEMFVFYRWETMTVLYT